MKQKELRILANWFGFDIEGDVLIDKYSRIKVYMIRKETEDDFGIMHLPIWKPHKDSNQLELLKNKFLKEANITRIEYDKMNSGWWQGTYYVGVSDAAIASEGKEIKDADLQAILSYVLNKRS